MVSPNCLLRYQDLSFLHSYKVKKSSSVLGYPRQSKTEVKTCCLFSVSGERYVPGVGRVPADDFMRREIIHKLCLRPMTHSELVKALPSDSDQEDEGGIDGIIESVSSFKYVWPLSIIIAFCWLKSGF